MTGVNVRRFLRFLFDFQKVDATGTADGSGGDNYDLLTNRIDRDDNKLFEFVRWCVDLSPAFTISKKVLPCSKIHVF